MSDYLSEQVLEHTIALHEKYQNTAESAADAALLEELSRFRIRVPVIGKFSAGKSTLLNTFLGYRTTLLAEDILPETAIPAELCYGDEDRVLLYPAEKDAPPVEWTVRDFLHNRPTPDDARKVRLELNNRKLAQIPQIDLVDMPGFDSGYQDHNRILDEYLPGSNAYILVFSADDATLKNNLSSILKELKLREKEFPLCVVLTRTGRCAPQELDELTEKLETSLKKLVTVPFSIYRVERDDPGSADCLLNFLEDLQENYGVLLERHYHSAVLARLERACLYLRERIRNQELSESDCASQAQRIQAEMERLRTSVEQQKNKFRASLPQCAELILADVEEMLRRKKHSYVQSLIKGTSIDNRLNEDVRAAVIQGVQTHFEPKLHAYLAQVETQIQSTLHLLSSPGMSGSGAAEALGAGLGMGVAAGGAAAALTSTGALGTLLSSSLSAGLATSLGASAVAVAVPVIGAVVAGLTALLVWAHRKAREKEQMDKLEAELESSVFPQLLNQLAQTLENALDETIRKAEAAIDQEIQEKQQLLQKALDDVSARQAREDAEARDTAASLQADLNEMEGLYREYA